MKTEPDSTQLWHEHHFTIPRALVLKRRRERAAVRAVEKLRRKCARKGKPFREAVALRIYEETFERGMKRDAATRGA